MGGEGSYQNCIILDTLGILGRYGILSVYQIAYRSRVKQTNQPSQGAGLLKNRQNLILLGSANSAENASPTYLNVP